MNRPARDPLAVIIAHALAATRKAAAEANGDVRTAEATDYEEVT